MASNAKHHDVIVVGGGPAGIGAALAAARNGASVLAIEKTNCLGGTLTNSLISMIRTAGDGGGIVNELWQRVVAEGGSSIGDFHATLNPFIARTVLFSMYEQARVDLLLHTHLAETRTDGNRVTGIRYANKDGLTSAHAKVVIDATGDADVAAQAGAPFDKGRDDGKLQAVSLIFVIANIHEDRLPPKDTFQATCRDAIASGRLAPVHLAGGSPIGSRTLNFGKPVPGNPPGIRLFLLDMADDVDASDAAGLTRGERVCNQHVVDIWKFLRDTFDAFADSVIVDVASHLGVRETRRIHGEKQVTEDMVLGALKCDDAISRCSWYMDLHDGQDKHPLNEYRAARHPPDGDWYEIPYGCLVPLEIDGLLVAGRSVSSTRAANGSLRLQPTCMNMGQAAGTAAALCTQRDLQPRRIDGAELNALLKQQGMEL